MFILMTGNPNVGKTQLLKLLASEGYDTFNIDEFVDEIYEVNQIGYILINTHFGREYTNAKTVDKKKLSELVLHDNYAMHKLKILIWPLIKSKLAYLKRRHKMMIVEMAIYKVDPLYFYDVFDYIIEISRCEQKQDKNQKLRFNKYYLNHPCYQPNIIIDNNDELFECFNELHQVIKTIK